ncbi:MAG: hypothetical protein FWH12_00090 [Treponema sp.]|nr:hypothetical protein [Treponema sp.]
MQLRIFLLVLILSSGLLGCAGSPDVFAPVDAEVRSGSFIRALVNFEEPRLLRNAYPPRNQILFHLDRGMLHHYAGQYGESFQDLHRAEQLIEEAFTRSITADIGTFIVNDNVQDYSGEDYEDLYINVFNALNFYHLNDLEGALVEIRRMNAKSNYLADKYEAPKRRVLNAHQEIDPSQFPMEASRFSNSALARYLGVLFYRGTGRFDSARIDLMELRRAYDLAPDVYYHPLPSSLAGELSIPSGMGRLNVIAFTGLAPIKKEENILIPLLLPFPHNLVRITFPVMESRPAAVQLVEVVLDTGERFALELLEDMGAVAEDTFKSRHGLIILKAAARSIVKNTAGAVSSAVVSDNVGAGAGLLMSLFTKIATEASEQADVRISRFFPRYALVGAQNLVPGEYTVTVNFHSGGRIVESQRQEIRIREQGLNLLQFVYLH